jgi:hypothetical protein
VAYGSYTIYIYRSYIGPIYIGPARYFGMWWCERKGCEMVCRAPVDYRGHEIAKEKHTTGARPMIVASVAVQVSHERLSIAA